MSLGDRMKSYYEKRYAYKLPMRLPVILRIDGKSFHTWTRKMKFERPYDPSLIKGLNETAQFICKNIMGAQIAYLQSDEISILIHNYKRLTSQAWFDNSIQKIVSVSASMATAFLNKYFTRDLAWFDARVFILPENEVCNYFIWRQIDWERNSLQMLARSHYSHKQLENKNSTQLHDLLHEKGVNWNDLPTHLKRGRCITYSDELKWTVDDEIPIFTQNRNYIEGYLEVLEE